MTVTYADPVRVDELSYWISFSSDRPTPVTFRVYDEGVLAETIESETGSASFLKHVAPGETPFLEVLDRDDERPALAFPSRMLINWLSVDAAAAYRIDR